MLRVWVFTIVLGFAAAWAVGQESFAPTDGIVRAKRAVVVPIEGEINGITAWVVKQRMERAQEEGVAIVVIKLDTPGGLAQAGLDIAKAIKAADKVHTLAYVDPNAYSAGALIALACNEIVITDGGRIGDCAPILPGGKLEGTEREKAESYIRAEFRDSARRNGYNSLLVESMVSADIGVFQIRNRRTGEIMYVDERDVRRLSDYEDASAGRTREDAKDWEYLKTVVGKGRLLTMTELEAKEYGFAKAIVHSDQEVQAYLGVTGWEVWKWNWGESLTGFFNSMAMTGILTAIGLLAIYIALSSPGLGLPEVVAIVCFAIVFGSKYLAGIAEWWTIALFITGILLLLVEVLVLPGFGVAGLAGLICVFVGLVGMVMPKDPGPVPFPQTPVAWKMFLGYLTWLIIGFFMFVAGAIALARYLPRIPKLGRLVLAEAPAATGAEAAHPQDIAPGISTGQTGTALTPLRPAGQVWFGEQVADVVAEGELIDRGSTVEVLRREGNRIVVRRKA